MARVTSDFFVSSLMRRVAGAGGFATIAKKGASEAGAVYIAVRERSGTIRFFGPAPQQAYQNDHPIDRYFLQVDAVKDDADLDKYVEKEARFDPDFWLVELELNTNRDELPFEITML
jgi:hypothetical protein